MNPKDSDNINYDHEWAELVVSSNGGSDKVDNKDSDDDEEWAELLPSTEEPTSCWPCESTGSVECPIGDEFIIQLFIF